MAGSAVINLNKKFSAKIAGATGFRLDESTGILHGNRGDFPMILAPMANKAYGYTAHLSVSRNGQTLDGKEMLTELKQESKVFSQVKVQGYHVCVDIAGGMTDNKSVEKISEALRLLPEYLTRTGCQACCEGCGQVVETTGYNIKGRPAQMCPACFTSMSNQIVQEEIKEANKKENILGGVIGALLGSLVGAAAIILILKLGYVAAISGVFMGFMALFGYRKFGGKLTTKGIIISVAIMAVTIYFANRFYFGMELRDVVRQYAGSSARSFSVFDGYKAIPELVKEDAEVKRGYLGSLAQIYMFTALGAVSPILQSVKERRMAFTAARI